MEVDEKDRFVRDVLFADLKIRKIGYGESLALNVSAEDFHIVIDRCADTGAGICGIEIFDVSRWERDHQVDFLGVWYVPDEGLEWARELVRQYAGQPNITVCASFFTPEEQAAHRANPEWRKECVDLEEALGGGIRKCHETEDS